MKVLLPVIWHDLTHCVARAFEEHGHEVRVVDWRRCRGEASRGDVERMCIDNANDFNPDLAFCQFQSAGIITSRFPTALREMGCFSVNWSGDVRSPLPDWYAELAPHFDVTSFTNWPDVHQIAVNGSRSEFLQVGYEERLYHDSDAPRSGVVFIGNNYGNKYPESVSRVAMVDDMRKHFGEAFAVYGMGWERYSGGYVREPGDADILRSSLVAVGMDHFFRPGFASDRLLRATACGCAVVQWHYEGIEHEHPHVIAVKSMDEMVNKVSALLGNPDEARRLGALNAANTLRNHRWHNRVETIETWVRSYNEDTITI